MKTLKNILLIIIGLLASYYLYSAIYEVIDNNSCAISQNGREILSRQNQIWIFILSMSLFHFAQLLISFLLFQIKKLRQISFGIFMALVLLVFYSGSIVFQNYDKQERIVKFSQKKWKNSKEKPISMVRDIYLNWGHCHTKEEIIELLGEPDIPDGIKLYNENYNWKLANDIYYLTDIKTLGCKNYLEFEFAFDNNNLPLKECNTINLVTFGENSQITINKYLELY